jgi:acyl carrier protein
MEEQQIFDAFLNILRPYAKDTDMLAAATVETHILNDLKVNSARLVDVIIKCEDTFDITVEDDEADKIRLVGDAVSLISRKLN